MANPIRGLPPFFGINNQITGTAAPDVALSNGRIEGLGGEGSMGVDVLTRVGIDSACLDSGDVLFG